MKPHTNTLNFLVGIMKRTDVPRPARADRPARPQHRLGVPLLLELLEGRRLALSSPNTNPPV
jgi:hypothetical protein